MFCQIPLHAHGPQVGSGRLCAAWRQPPRVL